MTQELKAGVIHRETLRVDDSLTVPKLSPHFTGFSSMPTVFATAFMVRMHKKISRENLARPKLAARTAD